MTDIIIIRDADDDTIKRILGKEEYVTKQVMKEDKQKKNTQKITKDTSKVVWTKKEIKILKTYYTKGKPNWTLLKQLLPNRTESAMKWRASSLGLCKEYKRYSKHKKHKKLEEKVEKKNKQKNGLNGQKKKTTYYKKTTQKKEE